MAIISIAKLLLLLGALTVIARGWLRSDDTAARLQGTVSPMILLTLAVMAISIVWTTGSTGEALAAIGKHGKLLLVPVLLCLIRSRREAMFAVAFFVGGQVILLISTWLMFVGIAIPWATSREAGISYAVFSSYLDQSIMTAVLAAVCWHMRSHAPARYRMLLSPAVSVLALACVFFVFQGRTGHLVSIMLVSMAVLWETPRRFRIGVVAFPFVLLMVLVVSSGKVSQGLKEIGSSMESFNNAGDISTSSGARLNFWHRSLQSIAENPWRGTGVGSWNHEFNRQEVHHSRKALFRIAGNPHQEYLLWGVELGVSGIALLCLVMLAFYRDSLGLEQPARRATQSILAALALACLFNCSLYDGLIGDYFCFALALFLAFGVHAAPLVRTTAPTRHAD